MIYPDPRLPPLFTTLGFQCENLVVNDCDTVCMICYNYLINLQKLI